MAILASACAAGACPSGSLRRDLCFLPFFLPFLAFFFLRRLCAACICSLSSKSASCFSLSGIFSSCVALHPGSSGRIQKPSHFDSPAP
jgi:hypothetical protein